MKCKAEITAFLSLIFILLVSFIGGVMEVASIQVSKNYRKADAERAMECIFAEYQKELLEQYDVFAMDTGYETGKYSENLIVNRLEYYGCVNDKTSIERIQFLSDNSAEAFYEQVCYYMKHKYGIEYVEKVLGMTDTWKKQESISKEYEKEMEKNEEQMEEAAGETENPISYVDNLKKMPILKLVMPDGMKVSEKTLVSESLPSKRTLNRGYGDFSEERLVTGTTESLLFDEYILEHFNSATDEKDKVIQYEVEYLLVGKQSDRENLKTVVNRLLTVRFVPNYTYLQGSTEKKSQARALALALSTLIAAPQTVEVLTQGILLAWAYGESIVDIRALLKGNRVPLTKTQGSWQLSISGLMKLGSSEDTYDGANQKNGWDYEDYLRMLLFLEKKENVAMRCLDLMEVNLKKICGLEFFRVDTCVTKMEVSCRCSLRRGITYTFPLYFGYQ